MASSLRERAAALETAIRLMDSLYDRLAFLQPPINRLIEAVGGQEPFNRLDYIQHTLTAIQKGERFALCWPKALSLTNSGLDKEDARVVAALSQNLGVTDLEGQLQFISYTRKLLEERLEKARANSQKSGKLYQSLGLLGGLAVVVILL